MKTALAIDSICYLFGVTSKDFETEVIKVLRRHEKEIRANQDKITRHACAESVLKENGVPRPYGHTITTDQACKAIMNTKAI